MNSTGSTFSERRNQQLIEEYLDIVVEVCKNFSEEQQEELVQIGIIGLIKGVHGLSDSKKDTTTFLKQSIQLEILTYLLKSKKSTKIRG